MFLLYHRNLLESTFLIQVFDVGFNFIAISYLIWYYIKIYAGERFGVEKVEPDPLNLLVKTDVGSISSS